MTAVSGDTLRLFLKLGNLGHSSFNLDYFRTWCLMMWVWVLNRIVGRGLTALCLRTVKLAPENLTL